MSTMESVKSFYTEKEDGIYLNPFLNKKERKIAEETSGEIIQNLINEFEKLQKEADELIEKINSQDNKGSFVIHLEHLKAKLDAVNAIGNFEEIYIQLSNHEHEIRTLIAQNREKNLAIKRALLEELKAIADQEEIDYTKSVPLVKEIQHKWMKTGAVDQEYKEKLEAEFKAKNESFFGNRGGFIEDKNRESEVEIAKYQTLIDESVEALESDDLSKHRKRIIAIQKEWKDLGDIPKPSYSKLFKKLRNAHNSFFTKLSDDFNNQNLNKRKALIAQLEELNKTNPSNVTEKVKEIQQLWKKSGKTEGKESNELFDNYFFLCDLIFERKRIYYLAKKKNKGEKNFDKALISAVRDQIRFQKQDAKAVEENFGNFRLTITSDAFQKTLDNKGNQSDRKLRVLETILEELKE